ncbi:MAG: ABC transporter ATP-binding protein [Endomicrobiia bacterium]|nr:ABC transporter ATP-binding protein [Endomicrobiia bacterium]
MKSRRSENPNAVGGILFCGRPVISARNLNYFYRGALALAIEDISFDIEPGETLVVAGPNGAGKTTLLMLAVGLIEGGGACDIFGHRAGPSGLSRYRRRVGFLFQNPDDQLFMPTVFEDVAFSLDADGLGAEEISRRVALALSRACFDEPPETPPQNLSFGEKKRAALAASLVTEPELLILDEPTLGLDPPSKRDFISLIDGLGAAKLISTHDFSVARALADKILFLERGRCKFYGPAGDFFASDLAGRFFGETAR